MKIYLLQHKQDVYTLWVHLSSAAYFKELLQPFLNTKPVKFEVGYLVVIFGKFSSGESTWWGGEEAVCSFCILERQHT